MIKYKQSWLHFEDIISPLPGQIIRQVIDLYTDEEIIPFYISSFFIELRVKSRFKGNELEFIQEKDFFHKNTNLILINLGNLNDWPSAISNDNLKHVRIEVEYIDNAPIFEENKIFKFLKIGYSFSSLISEYSQPEFYYTAPLGMKLKCKNDNFIEVLIEEKEENKNNFIKLFLEKGVYQRYFNRKIKYYFLIDEKSYEKILSTAENPKIDLKSIQIYYDCVYQKKFWFVSLVPILLSILALLNVFISPIGNLSNFNLSGIIIFISFLTFFYSLIREGYELPINKKFILLTILISGFIILFPQFIKSFLI